MYIFIFLMTWYDQDYSDSDARISSLAKIYQMTFKKVIYKTGVQILELPEGLLNTGLMSKKPKTSICYRQRGGPG